MSLVLTDLTSTYDLSCNGSLTIGGEELGGFKSGSLSFSADTVENSTRDDQGWKSNAPGNRSATLEVTFNKIANNACQIGLRKYVVDSDFLTSGVAIVYKSASAAGGGFSGVFVLTAYSENQGMDGTAVECSATFMNYGEITSDATTSSGSGSST